NAFGLGPRLLKTILSYVSLLESKRSDQSKSVECVCRLGYHHFALRARGVTPCDTSHDVAPTSDFSGSGDETNAQALAQGPYLMIRRTDGAYGGRGELGGNEQASEMQMGRFFGLWSLTSATSKISKFALRHGLYRENGTEKTNT
ncbi:hypothetical protein THAOC_07854, partial [Thalassiosira oceanica]